MTRPAKLDSHDLRRVAVEAGCDPRTVTRHLDGEPVRGPVKARIADALRKLGLVPPPGIAAGPEVAILPRAPSSYAASRTSPVVALDAEPAPREEAIR